MLPRSISILIATSDQKERELIIDMVASTPLPYVLALPESLKEVDSILSQDTVNIILADLGFANGAFADWLSLWPRPFILLVSYGEEERLDNLIGDEACSFILRDSEYRHLSSLPTMIRKVLNVRESLDRSNAHFQISERRYLDLVNALPDIVYSLDSTGHIMYINESVSQLGYSSSELFGKHFSVLIEEADLSRVSRSLVLQGLNGTETGLEGAPKLFDERRTGNRMTRNLELRLRHKINTNSSLSKGLVDAYGEISSVGFALPEYEGSAIGTVGIIRDISIRKNEMLKLEEDVQTRELLLKELHHRVNNNLQIISSLLNLQSLELVNESAKKLIHNFQAQIYSVAMVHEQLYRSDKLQFIEMSDYISSLISYLFNSYDAFNECVTSSISCVDIALDVTQAIPIGLIINELLVNSVRHGMARKNGHVSVEMDRKDDKTLCLCIKDAGEGYPPGFSIDIEQLKKSDLIGALCSQLEGTFEFSTDNALQFTLLFPYKNEAGKGPF